MGHEPELELVEVQELCCRAATTRYFIISSVFPVQRVMSLYYNSVTFV